MAALAFEQEPMVPGRPIQRRTFCYCAGVRRSHRFGRRNCGHARWSNNLSSRAAATVNASLGRGGGGIPLFLADWPSFRIAEVRNDRLAAPLASACLAALDFRRLMLNPRRRRTILVVVPLFFVLVGQLPNLYLNVFQDRGRASRNRSAEQPRRARGGAEVPPGFVAAHQYVPPLWVANGAMGLASGNAWPALWHTGAAFAIGALGLGRAYRSTIRFYQGKDTSLPSTEARRKTDLRSGTRKRFLERRLPAIPEQAAALSLAFFRSMIRAPEVRMAVLMNLIMAVVLSVIFFARSRRTPEEFVKPFGAAGAVGFTFLGMVQLLFNQFGFERDGFRALVLLPIRRQHTLIAKNISFFPIAIGVGLVVLAIVASAIGFSVLVFLAACLQLIAMFLLLSIAGNYVSIIAPYRIEAGSLKPTKAPLKTSLLIFFAHLLFPVAMIPILLPPALAWGIEKLGWFASAPVNASLSLLLVAMTGGFYWLSIQGLGSLLQRREKDILQVVTREIE
ncbi:MAG: ABC transporter permease [Verrucomicrobia bacterium]|nr:ABC transporter permease [Verrucomicrobiota bacterium]